MAEIWNMRNLSESWNMGPYLSIFNIVDDFWSLIALVLRSQTAFLFFCVWLGENKGLLNIAIVTKGGSRVLGRGGHILNQLSVHDITGDIKCIIAVHCNFNAC